MENGDRGSGVGVAKGTTSHPPLGFATGKADHGNTAVSQYHSHPPRTISQRADQLPPGHSVPPQIDRQRSTDSLSEYSSLSEGESPYPTLVAGRDAGVSAKPPKGAKKATDGKRSSKKAKRRKKGGKDVEEAKGRGRRVVQRSRSDSYTTSSDEERWLEGRREGGGKEGEEGREEVDEEQVKAKLQRRIESRKPPSHFETPATDAIFHQVQQTLYTTWIMLIHVYHV